MGESDVKPGAILPEEVQKKLESEHGEICAIMTRAGPAAFRGPTRSEYRRHFAAIQQNEKERPERIEQFLLQLVVYPAGNVLNAMLEKKPGIGPTCYNALMSFAGLEDEKETKKYETGSGET